MSSTEISPVVENFLRRAGWGIYGGEECDQLVQHGIKICGAINSIAEFGVPGAIPRFLAHEGGENNSHLQAIKLYEYLGKFSDSVSMIPLLNDEFIPKVLLDEFMALYSRYIFGAKISSIDDQLVKLTEKVALASGQEIATGFASFVYHLILGKEAKETHRRLQKFMKGHYYYALFNTLMNETLICVNENSELDFAIEAYGISMDDPHVRIDIPEDKYGDKEDMVNKKGKSDHMGMISTSILGMTAQAGGALLSNAFGNPKSNHKWALDAVEVSMVVGFGLTLGGIGLCRIKPMLSVVMIKAGAIATASAFIASMAMPLSPPVAWTIGPVAAGVVAISVVMA